MHSFSRRYYDKGSVRALRQNQRRMYVSPYLHEYLEQKVTVKGRLVTVLKIHIDKQNTLRAGNIQLMQGTW